MLDENVLSYPEGSEIRIQPNDDGVNVGLKLVDGDDSQNILNALLDELSNLGVMAPKIDGVLSQDDFISTPVVSDDSSNGQVMLGYNDLSRFIYAPKRTENGNMAIFGAPGQGKTTLMRRMIHKLGEDAIVVVFDPGGDMYTPNEMFIPYHGESQYGINPLEIGLDSVNGGPRVQVLIILEFLAGHFKNIGIRQKDVMRKIIYKLYELHGISDDASTWEKQCPSMVDVFRYLNDLNKLMANGYYDLKKKIKKNKEDLSITEEHYKRVEEKDDKKASELASKMIRYESALSVYEEEIERVSSQIGDYTLSIGKTVCFANFADDFWADAQQLNSVLSSMRELEDTGMFGKIIPRFDKPGVYHIDLQHLENAPRQLLIETTMRNIMRERQRQGHKDWKYPLYLFHDEAKDTLDKHSRNPFAIPIRIGQQGRKYGIRYIIAGQSDKMVPQGLRTAFEYRVIMSMGGDGEVVKGLARQYAVSEENIRKLVRGLALLSRSGGTFNLFNLPPFED